MRIDSVAAALVPAGSAGVQRDARQLIGRHFFGCAATVALLAASLFLFLPQGLDGAQRVPLVLSLLALGMLAMLSMRAADARVGQTVALLSVGAIGVIALSGTWLEWGIRSPGLGFFGLLCCMVYAAAGARLGWLVAAVAAATVLLLALGQHRQWWPTGPQPLSPEGLGVHTLLQLLVIGSGLAAGALIARMNARYLGAADEREQRFRRLLEIAADAYWEIDARYRLLTFKHQSLGDQPPGPRHGIGQIPWELPQFDIDDDTLDLLLAHLEAREAFRDLPLRWTDAARPQRHFVVSGEPRFDAQANFVGYWGVARDVSADVQARQALQATETRYLDLFTRIPTPLVLHDNGRVLDANPSALDLFGHADLHAMLGADLLASYEGGDSRERARRCLESLRDMPAGEALPVSEYRLLRGSGERTVVRATGVRVDTPLGPAVLSIFVDDTERKKAEDAVRRSEAMLSHLVATSPDVITLTDLPTGRYAMVNKTFERQTGYSAAEVVGRSAIDLGIWHDLADRERFVAAIREHGRVQDMPVRFVTKSGALISLLVSGARFAMDRRDYLVINARDVSQNERTRLEREAILQNASVGIAVTRERRFVLANPRFEQMYGWPAGALAGQSGRVVWDSDADYQRAGATLGPLLEQGQQAEMEIVARRRDGSTFLAQVRAKAIDPTNPAGGGTIWIVDDVTERRQVEQALARARDAAEAANRAKSAFLANTSHELRTPLNGLIGLARLAAAADAGEERRQQYLQQIGETAQALAAIISDILDLSKIEAGRLELEAVAFDLGDLLRTLQRAYGTLADARALALRVEFGPEVSGPVRGDPLRVRQILSNFLSNALKFTARGEVRLVAARLDGGRVRFEVHDSGQGIDAPTQQRLFRPFTQADESTTRRYGGTGLGLSICRELAQLMGGEVGVRSQIGQGSCFWAELPLPATSAEAASVPMPEAADSSLRGARVLMVEDNAVNMLIAATLLEQWGVQVTQAGDGLQAVEAVRRQARQGMPFDAVLMDVQMPLMSGHEATRALRREFDAEALPIIALTAAALVSEREQALAAGMNDFMTKPIDAQRLQAALQRWIARRGGAVESA